ncbi:high mobility group box domain-containing protein, partial [Amylostereum chailletii]
PARIPRPPNPFMLYRKDYVRDHPERFVRMKQSDISKIVGEMWHNESPAVKSYYERQAALVKEEHALRYPGYRYAP